MFNSIGDLDIELWSKECPIACRNFVQHCLDGYYNKCQFYYVEPGVRAFTGDPTNTGEGGESAFGGVFRDEHHSRLRFTRRGLVAMIGKGQKHSNTSHFFITLGSAPHLNLKHTIFGTITGQTTYNVNHLAKREVVGNKYARPVIIIEVCDDPWHCSFLYLIILHVFHSNRLSSIISYQFLSLL